MKIIVNANHPEVQSFEALLKTQTKNGRQKLKPLSCFDDFYTHLLLSLHYPLAELPAGALFAHAFNLTGRWVVASPAHWQATHNDAMLLPCNKDMFANEAFARRCFADFEQHVREEGLALFYIHPTLWLMRCDNKPLLKAKPLAAVLHQSLMPQLKQFDSSMRWQRFLTETQMFFSQNHLNQMDEEASGMNGLWFWGDAHITPSNQPIWVFDPALSLQVTPLSRDVRHLAIDSLMSTHKEKIVLNREAILVFKELTASELKHLEKRVKGYATEWYWNNVAYRVERQGLLKRCLWSFS